MSIPLNVARAATVGLALVAARAAAQIPDRFENLQVLPKDIGKPQLVAVMRGFAGALGVRCLHCHVGDDPDLVGVDFASDAKEAKRTAPHDAHGREPESGSLCGA